MISALRLSQRTIVRGHGSVMRGTGQGRASALHMYNLLRTRNSSLLQALTAQTPALCRPWARTGESVRLSLKACW